MSKLLFEDLKRYDAPDLFFDNYELPSYLQDNLKGELRYYQKEALRYLHYAQRIPEADMRHNHLLFHMATGSGKTMVMAAAILYLFKEYGYQNFIFFVHTDAIIQKTKENLLNELSSKYLFKQPLEIEGERITVEAVDTFPANPQANTIYLKLSTIHKIHGELNNYRENSVTYEDLQELPLVLLGDEAHHFNAITRSKAKKLSAAEEESLTWERTVQNLLNLNKKNRLFEFTATINLDNKGILAKYQDKIVYQYDLKRFMLDGFSKKVMLLQANQSDEEKMLDAVLLSQYRKLIAQDNGIAHFKPIVLFKSPQIAVSNAKHAAFNQLIEQLTPSKISQHLKTKADLLSSTSSVWNQVINYYNQAPLLSIVQQIQQDFAPMNILNVNKQDILEEYPVLLNTLEEPDNPFRAIFAVAKVNEGWDVLNLYDIVRISEKASSNSTGTDSEAQLIGRGARYYPFVYQNEKSYSRRFDNAVSGLAVLEQMHYHTINETGYISNLHKSLEQSALNFDVDGNATVHHAKLKAGFKKSAFYQQGKVYFNRVVEIQDSERTWGSYSLEKSYEVDYQTITEASLADLSQQSNANVKTQTLTAAPRLWVKALQKIQFFYFDNLKRYFPALQSTREFVTSEAYLGGIAIYVNAPQTVDINALGAKEKLLLIESVLTRIADNLRRNYKKFKGTYTFQSKPLKEMFTDYSVYIDSNLAAVNQRITAENSTGKPWYVYDNAILNQLEHRLVRLVEQMMEKLSTKYEEIYLLRNDEKTTRFKLTEFGGVRGFMPDFIMLLKEKEGSHQAYQVFLEPKGADRLLNDKWKEQMLDKICDENLVTLEEDGYVRLLGIKFYSETTSNQQVEGNVFVEDFEKKLFDGKELIPRHSVIGFEI